MHRALAIALAVGALTASSASAQEAPTARAPRVVVGMGEQDPGIFADSRFRSTGIRNARLIVPYDVVKARGWPLDVADIWLERARREGIEPLVTFSHAWGKKRQFHLPSVREYAKRVAEFRARYPWVHEYSTWNEANLASAQPTGRHPRRAAAFYRALRRQCKRCTVVAVEILLTGNWKTWRWLHAFRKRAGRGPEIFGVHNYPDVTRLRGRVTRSFLRHVRHARVWITETGGIVQHNRWEYNEDRAARAVRHVFKLTSELPRIERLYLYNWRFDGNKRWDSGLIAKNGTERMAYYELLDGLTLDRFTPVPVPIDEPVAPTLPEPPAEPPGDGGD
jgi:polysaccharide biosynthesis protein PslG